MLVNTCGKLRRAQIHLVFVVGMCGRVVASVCVSACTCFCEGGGLEQGCEVIVVCCLRCN